MLFLSYLRRVNNSPARHTPAPRPAAWAAVSESSIMESGVLTNVLTRYQMKSDHPGQPGAGLRRGPVHRSRAPRTPREGPERGQVLPPSGRARAGRPRAAAAQCRPLAAPLLLPIGLGLRAFQTWRSGSGGRGRLAPGAPGARPARGWTSARTASIRCWPCTRPECLPSLTPTPPASTTWRRTRAS